MSKPIILLFSLIFSILQFLVFLPKESFADNTCTISVFPAAVNQAFPVTVKGLNINTKTIYAALAWPNNASSGYPEKIGKLDQDTNDPSEYGGFLTTTSVGNNRLLSFFYNSALSQPIDNCSTTITVGSSVHLPPTNSLPDQDKCHASGGDYTLTLLTIAQTSQVGSFLAVCGHLDAVGNQASIPITVSDTDSSNPALVPFFSLTDADGNYQGLIGPFQKGGNIKIQAQAIKQGGQAFKSIPVVKKYVAISSPKISLTVEELNQAFSCTPGKDCPSAAGDPCVVNGIANSGINTVIGCIPTDPTTLIQTLLKFAIGIGGGIALLLMIAGAFQMMTSGGNPEALKKGTAQMTSAVIGLLFIIFSVMLLQIIGVDILNLPGFGK